MGWLGSLFGAKRGPARRNLEDPTKPLNWNDEEDWEAFGAERTAAGVRVSRDRVLGYPAVWRAVSLIAGDVAKLPLYTYRTGAGTKDVDRAHPAYRLLRYKANPNTLAYHAKETLTLHALVAGDGYAFIDRDGPKPVGLFILDPYKVEPILRGGELWYLWGAHEGAEKARKIPASDILHIKGLGWDGMEGFEVLRLLRDSFGAALAARDYGARNFRNSARPGGVIEHPAKLSPQARTNMRESWDRIHKGLDNAHKIAIMEEGSKFVPLAASAREAQLLESREFDSREIANIFGVPAHKLGDPSKVAYNSLGEENQSYYNDTLSKWLNLWAAECSDKLLSEAEKEAESHAIDFDYREVQRANLAALTAYAQAAEGRWNTTDEVRALFGDNPLKPGQTIKPAAAPEPEAKPAPEPELAADRAERAAALRPLLVDAARRLARRLADTAHKARAGEFEDWSGALIGQDGAWIVNALAPVVKAAPFVVGNLPAGQSRYVDFVTELREAVRSAWPDHIQAGAEELAEAVANKWADRVLAGTA